MNLYDMLPEHDRKVMHNYVTEHGIIPERYIGNQMFFNLWAESKTKLYHLLGNKFIHKIPYELERPISEFDDEMRKQCTASDFAVWYRKAINNIFDKYNLSVIAEMKMKNLTDAWTLAENKIHNPITLDFILEKKIVKIQAGTKPLKAIVKVMEYCGLEYNKEDFEKFRLAHSVVLNTKILKGNLCFSIHPMDFMTMSDNGYGWSSCMSWMEHGCYFMGSEEMMNSNNVICCYLESASNPLFCFKKKAKNHKVEYKPEDYPEYSWNSKKWRILFYVNKEIICSGKSYPYADTKLTFAALEELQKLAKENMKWTYAFGPQEYNDHKGLYADDWFDLDEVRDNPQHKKILFDTQAMYHDMMNDHDRDYYCVRNPVKKTKLISISGKVRCLCCGDTEGVRQESDRGYRESYNDKVENPESLVCPQCYEDYFECQCCLDRDIYTPDKKMLRVEKIGLICNRCYNYRLRICPCCNEVFDTTYYAAVEYPLVQLTTKDKHTFRDILYIQRRNPEVLDEEDFRDTGFAPAVMCSNCRKKFIEENGFVQWNKKGMDIEAYDYADRWEENHYGQYVSPTVYSIDDESISKYFPSNLEYPSILEEC